MPRVRGEPECVTMVQWTVVPASGHATEGVPRAFTRSRDCEPMKALEQPPLH